MLFELKPLKPGETDWEKFLAVVIPAIAFVAVALILLDAVPVCQLRLTTGFPCPACGSIRAARRLMTLDWRGAFFINPLMTIAAPTAIITAFYCWIVVSFRLPRLRFGKPGIAAAALAAAFFLNWLYLILNR